jgi:hypothetical protein
VPLEITLSSTQVQALATLAQEHPHSITIRNEGDPFLLVDLHDAGGAVVDRFRVSYEEQDLIQVAP